MNAEMIINFSPTVMQGKRKFCESYTRFFLMYINEHIINEGSYKLEKNIMQVFFRIYSFRVFSVSKRYYFEGGMRSKLFPPSMLHSVGKVKRGYRFF